MAKKSRLTRVAVKIGSAIGRADRKAHQVVKAGKLAKKELADISKQVDALRRQLQTATKRLRRALTYKIRNKKSKIKKTGTNSVGESLLGMGFIRTWHVHLLFVLF